MDLSAPPFRERVSRRCHIKTTETHRDHAGRPGTVFPARRDCRYMLIRPKTPSANTSLCGTRSSET